MRIQAIAAQLDDRKAVTLLGIAGLAGFYALALDQGLILSLFHGNAAFDQNVIHEVIHDARHALGMPCH